MKKIIASNVSDGPLFGPLSGLELKPVPGALGQHKRRDQDWIPVLVGTAGNGGLDYLKKIMGILGKDKMQVLLKISYQSETAFHAACGNNRVDVMEFLYSNFEIDLEERSGRVRITPLFNAVAGHAKEATQWLVQRGAKKDTPVNSGKTPYQIAIKQNLTDILEILNSY